MNNYNRALTADLFGSFSMFIGIVLLAYVLAPTPEPRLVGYGCEGASGLLYANEESDFPPCKTIEEND